MARGGRKKKWQNKTVYICTAAYKNNFETRYAIHSIHLMDLLSPEEETRADETKGDYSANSNSGGNLHIVDSINSSLIPRGMHCGVFGSQILFAGGRDFYPGKRGETSRKIYVFETDPTVDPNPEIKEFNPRFLQGKRDPFLVELKGNLYALGGVYAGSTVYESPCFEVFSKKTQRWYPKCNPPFFNEHVYLCGHRPPYLSCAIAGTKILVSCPNNPKVFCYDVDKLRCNDLGEWKILSGSDYGLPFIGNALVLDLEDGTNILFSSQFFYCYILRHHHEIDRGIVPYRMTINDSDSRISILPIKTKALGREVVPPVFWSPTTSHSFVHLGGRKVCCVLASQISAEDGNSIDKMLIAFITFEFRCTAKSNDDGDDDDDEFSVENLTTRICEYDFSKECTSDDIYHATLVGCFQR